MRTTSCTPGRWRTSSTSSAPQVADDAEHDAPALVGAVDGEAHEAQPRRDLLDARLVDAGEP